MAFDKALWDEFLKTDAAKLFEPTPALHEFFPTSPVRAFAWLPAKTQDRGWVWLRRVWIKNGELFLRKPEPPSVRVTSRPMRVPFQNNGPRYLPDGILDLSWSWRDQADGYAPQEER